MRAGEINPKGNPEYLTLSAAAKEAGVRVQVLQMLIQDRQIIDGIARTRNGHAYLHRDHLPSIWMRWGRLSSCTPSDPRQTASHRPRRPASNPAAHFQTHRDGLATPEYYVPGCVHAIADLSDQHRLPLTSNHEGRRRTQATNNTSPTQCITSAL